MRGGGGAHRRMISLKHGQHACEVRPSDHIFPRLVALGGEDVVGGVNIATVRDCLGEAHAHFKGRGGRNKAGGGVHQGEVEV